MIHQKILLYCLAHLTLFSMNVDASEVPAFVEILGMDPDGPSHGRLIRRILPQGIMRDNGFMSGLVVTHNNGIEQFPNEKVNRASKVTAKPNVIHLWDGEKNFEVHSDDLFGYNAVEYFSPEKWYRRHGQRSVAWDNLLIESAQTCKTQPSNSRVKLNKALTKGYKKDGFCYYLRAQQYYYSSQPEEAVLSIRKALADSNFYPFVSNRDLLMPLLAAGDIQGIYEHTLNATNSSFFDTKSWENYSRYSIEKASTSLLSKVKQRDVTHRLRPNKALWSKEGRANVNQRWLGRYPIYLNSSPGNYNKAYLHLDPQPKDFLLRFQCKIKTQGPRHPHYANSLALEIFNGEGPFDTKIPNTRKLLSLTILLNDAGFSEMILAGSQQPDDIYAFCPMVVPDGMTPAEVLMIRLRGQLEIVINGVRVLQLPERPQVENLVYRFTSVGLDVTVDDFAVVSLDEEDQLATPSMPESYLTENLLLNPENELPLQDRIIQHWTALAGNWTSRKKNPPPAKGEHYFFAGKGAFAELQQEVPIPSSLKAVPRNFNFTGMLRSYKEGDLTRFYVSAFIGDDMVKDYATECSSYTDHWNHVSLKGQLPLGTTSLKVSIISIRENGSNNDGYFDDLSLRLY